MGNMEGVGIFLWNAVITLFSFLAVAPIVLSAVSQFGVQKRFAQAMIDEGIISAEEVKLLQPKKQIAGVVISVILVGALIAVAARTAPYGYFSCGIAAIAGALKYRQILEFNSLTVSRFKNTYQSVMNASKYDQYVKKMF